jgi:hypothetical protein
MDGGTDPRIKLESSSGFYFGRVFPPYVPGSRYWTPDTHILNFDIWDYIANIYGIRLLQYPPAP